MTEAALLLVDTPKDPAWELDWESLHGVRTGLLSWVTAEPQVDAGVPRPIAELLARAFCRNSTVTYLCSQVPESADGAWRTSPIGAMCRIRSNSIVQRQYYPLLATRRPEVAVQLFDDERFQWFMRAQAVVLSDPNGALPALDWGLLDGALGKPIQTPADRLRAAGVLVLIVPGVDGCVAGFYFLDEAFGSTFVATLQTLCLEMNIPGEVLSEAQFRERLMGPAVKPA